MGELSSKEFGVSDAGVSPQAAPPAPPAGETPTPAQQTPAPQAQGEPKKGDTGAAVDGDEDLASSKGKDYAIVKLRADRRSLREDNERLKEQLALVQTKQGDSVPAPTTQAREENVEGLLAPQTHQVRDVVREEMRQAQLEQESDDAVAYLLSQDDVTQQDLTEIGRLMQRHKLDLLAKKYPLDAAEVALDLWRTRKTRAVNPQVKAEATSIPSSSAGGPGGAKRVFTRAEISAMSSTEYEKNRDDILAAQKEGRIK